MNRITTGLLAIALLTICGKSGKAQGFEKLYPIQRPTNQAVAAYVPTSGTYRPLTTSSTAVAGAWEPAASVTYTSAYGPTVCYEPVPSTTPVASYTPAACYTPAVSYSQAIGCAPAAVRCYSPVVGYSPVAVQYPAPAYCAYAPVTSNYAATVAAAYPGRKVWVHPKVYVAGQPIRNLIKAITP